jgi:hypothetical protein
MSSAFSFKEKIHHLANQMITIDLDDGAKVNHVRNPDAPAKIG